MNLTLPFFKRARPIGLTIVPNFNIHGNGPGVMVEQVYAPDHVFDPAVAEHLLITYDSVGRELAVYFHPPSKERNVLVAKLIVLSNRDKLLQYELPELTERANYKQICNLDQYKSIASTLSVACKSRSTGAGMPGWGVGLLVGLGLLCSILLFSSPGQVAQPGAPTKNPVAAATPPALLSAGDQLNDQEKALLSRVVSQSGIELSSGGKSFVIFSDPNCPACRELEGKLAKLDASLSPVIVPVSFKPSSREAVAGVLCSKEVAASWRAAATGAPASPTCAKGLEQADANNAAFVALKFDRTPTIVTSSGKVAVGAKDFDGLMRWIRENSGV